MIFHGYVKQPDGNPTWCPSSIAKMVQISPISLWLLLVIYHDISIVFMGIMKAIKKTGGAPPCTDPIYNQGDKTYLLSGMNG